MITAGTLLEAVKSHALASGLFDKVNGAEPKSAPPATGITAAVWVQTLRPVQASGLNTTSFLFSVSVRLYASALADPPDMIDPTVMAAADVLLNAYTGDFTLDGLVESIDLLGRHSDGLGGEAGYVAIDGLMQRVFTITVPMIVHNVYVQEP